MRIAVPAETDPGEARVAATPETVKKIYRPRRRCGRFSREPASNRAFPMRIMPLRAQRSRQQILSPMRRHHPARAAARSRRARRRPNPAPSSCAIMDPYDHDDALQRLATAGVKPLRDGADAAHHPRPGRWTCSRARRISPAIAPSSTRRPNIGRAIPMMMTAAGTVPAAKIFIMGVGVAGLQAIATARRLGGVVTATDVRPADEGTGRAPRREIHRRRGRGIQAGRDRRRLRQGNVGRLSGKAGGADRFAYRQAGHRDHHGADPRPPGARAIYG